MGNEGGDERKAYVQGWCDEEGATRGREERCRRGWRESGNKKNWVTKGREGATLFARTSTQHLCPGVWHAWRGQDGAVPGVWHAWRGQDGAVPAGTLNVPHL